jgi:hypothetical protein
MPIVKYLDSVRATQGISQPSIEPIEGIPHAGWEYIVIGDGTAGWIDKTGKHAVTLVGTPPLIANQMGFQGSSTNCLEVDFKETDWTAGQDFVAVTVGRFFQDGVYASAHFMGSISGTSPTDYRGWSMGVNYNTPSSEVRNMTNVSVLRSGTEYRQNLFYSHPKALADVARYRLQIMRVRHVGRSIQVFSFDGYNGTDTLTGGARIATATLNVADQVTGRLQGNTNIRMGTFNGGAGSDQSQFIMGALYKGDMTDTQIKDLANGIRNQFRSEKTIDGVATLGGFSTLRGMTPFDLYAAALT